MSAPAASLANVGGCQYYIPTTILPTPSDYLHVLLANPGHRPVSQNGPATLFVLDDAAELKADHLASEVESWLRTDDVFTSSFLVSVYVLVTSGSVPELDDSVADLLEKWGTENAHVIKSVHHQRRWHSGPYFADTRGLRPAWRLFPDSNAAFVFPVVPQEDNPRRFAIPGTAGVPVPSRCHFGKPTPQKPLLGMRVAIKDNIDMAGVTTSAGNRAYGELYGPRAENAAVVDRLLDAGAVVVGRVKTVPFASGENARDWIDFHAPFNPRGDGYQDPGCSSAGSATAVSAYDWVDIALGTDTFGSVIGPASEHGLFALRPSLNGIPTTGVVPQSEHLDTVGFFCRTSTTASAATRALTTTNINKRFCSSRLQILYPVDFFDGWPPDYIRAIQSVVTKLERFLGISKDTINVRDRFVADNVGDGKSLEEYLENTTAHIQLRDCYRNCLPFLEKYEETFNRSAFADPFIQYKWKLGKELTAEQYSTAVSQMSSFRDWMLSTILPATADDRDFTKILIMPNGYMDPFYRSQYDGLRLEEGAQRKQGFGFKDSFMTALTGLPFFTIPIGQLPYKSEISNRIEFLSMNIGFMGPKGSDDALVHLLDDFLTSLPGLHSSVRTGRTFFTDEIIPRESL